MSRAGSKRKQKPSDSGAPAARRPFPKLRWLGIVFVLPSVLYVTWVFGQLRAIEERNLRHLALAADSVEDSLRVAQRNVESLGKDPSDALAFEKRQPYLWLDAERDQDSREVLGWLESVAPAAKSEAFEVRTGYGSDSNGTFLLARFSVEVPATVTDAVQQLVALHGLQIGDEAAKKAPDALVAFRLGTDALLAGESEDSALEHLLLVSDEGRVVDQVSPTGAFGERPAAHRLLDVNRLETVERAGLGLGRDEGTDDDGADGTGPKSLVFGASSVRGVLLAGERYDMLCQPLRVETFVWREREESGRSSTWALCGLSAPRRALRQALSIAPHFALGLVLFLLLGLLAWPFAKLALMHRLERLRFADVFMLLFITFAALLILPLALVHADAYLGLQKKQRAALENLAATVDERLDEHLRSLYRVLDRFDREESLARSSAEDVSDRVHLFRAPDYGDWVDDQRAGTDSTGNTGEAGPRFDHFGSIFWTDREGEQVAKMTTRDKNTPPVPLAYRDYVRTILRGEGWPVPSKWVEEAQASAPPPTSFYFQTYASATTGERSMALSIPSRFCKQVPGSEDCAPYVAAITSRPLWLLEPALPPGVAFAIVDEEGHALFHSVGHRALEENLFDELSNHQHLRSAMQARRAVHLGSRYRTRPHQIWVQPARSVPWWIVTLSDNEVAGAVNLESLGQTAVLAVPYTLGLLLIAVAAYVLTRRRGGAAFLWPDRTKRRFYRRSFWASLVLAVIFGLLICTNSGGRLQVIALLMPLAAALANGLLASPWLKLSERLRGEVKASWERVFQLHVSRPAGEITATQLRWHLAGVVCIWLILAVLPGIALFKPAWDDQTAALLKLEAVSLAGSAADRARWLETEYRRTGFAESGPLSHSTVLEARWQELSEVHRAASLFATSLEKPGSAPTAPALEPSGWSSFEGLELADSLARYKPIYNLTIGGLRHLRRGDPDQPRSFDWIPSADGSLAWLDAGPPAPRDVLSSWSDRPRLSAGPWTLLGGVVLLAALVFWVRWSALRLFFARIGSRLGEHGFTLTQVREIGQPVIALVPSPTDRRLLVETGNPEIIDLSPSDPSVVERKIADLAVRGRRQVVCVNFAADLESAERRRWKLRQLERLVYEKERRVVLRAVNNPLEELFRDTVEGDEQLALGASIRLDAVEAQRWGRLLHRFVVYPVTAKPPTMDRELKRLYERGLPKGLGRKHEELERKLEIFESFYWALWSSCSPEERLVLVQLAQENFLNPKQEPNVRRLLQKGLLKREPRLQLMDDGFELFVRRIHEPVEIAKWESSGQGMGWQQIRWGFVSLLAVVAIFLIATQQELVDVTLAFLSAILVGGLPGILEILSRLRRSGGRALPR